jgi:hypothetical protein
LIDVLLPLTTPQKWAEWIHDAEAKGIRVDIWEAQQKMSEMNRQTYREKIYRSVLLAL